MRKYIIISIVALLLVVSSILLFMPKKKGTFVSAVNYEARDYKDIEYTETSEEIIGVPKDYEWVIHFNEPIAEDSVNETTINVTDSDQQMIDVNIEVSETSKTIHIINPSDYDEGSTYLIELDGLLNKDGEKILENELIQFTTRRTEIEDIVYLENLIHIENDDLLSMTEKEIKLPKKYKDISEGSILIVYPEFQEAGLAIKVTSIETGFRSQKITYEKPDFAELFEMINIYKSYEINDENIEIMDNITLTSGKVTETSANLKTIPAKDKPYELPFVKRSEKESSLNFSIDDQEISLGDNQVIINGDVQLFNPEVLIDAKINSADENYLQTLMSQQEIMNIDIQMIDSQNTELEKNLSDIELDEIPLAAFNFPTSIDGMELTGQISLALFYDQTGEIQAHIETKLQSETGILAMEDDIAVLSNHKSSATLTGEGSGKAIKNIVTNLNAQLIAYGVTGFDLSTETALNYNSEWANGEDDQVGGEYSCLAYLEEISFHTDVLINFNGVDAIYTVDSPTIDKEKDNCLRFIEYTFSDDQVDIENDSKSIITVQENYINLLTLDNTLEEAQEKQIKVEIADEGVAQVTISNNEIIVESLEIPEQEETDIIVTTKLDDDLEWIIPIKITNYDEVLEKVKEAERKEQIEALEGSWYIEEPFYSSTLGISNIKDNTFDYFFDNQYGGRFDYEEGTATINEDGKGAKTTSYDESFGGCIFTFTFKENVINVERGDCTSVSSSTFGGDYEREKQEVVFKDLSESGYISKRADENIKKAAGKYYEELKQNTQLFGELDTPNELNARIIETRVLSAGEYNIIMIDENEDIYVGMNSRDEKNANLVYFTSNPAYKNNPPDVIQKWLDKSYFDGKIIFLD